jgi:hypothetical protein
VFALTPTDQPHLPQKIETILACLALLALPAMPAMRRPPLAGVFVAVFEDVTALGLFLDEVFAFGVGGFAQEPLAAFFVGIGDVVQEDEAEDDVFARLTRLQLRV